MGMTTPIGLLGPIPDSLRTALRARGHDVHDGNADVIVARAQGNVWPTFPKDSVVVALCDSLDACAAAYRAGAHFVAPIDPEIVGILADRARPAPRTKPPWPSLQPPRPPA